MANSVYFVLSWNFSCFSKWRRRGREEEPLQHNPNNCGPSTCHSVGGVWSKLPLPVVPETHQRTVRRGRGRHHLWRLPSVTEYELSQWRVSSMAAHWYDDAVTGWDGAVKVLRLKWSRYLRRVSPGTLARSSGAKAAAAAAAACLLDCYCLQVSILIWLPSVCSDGSSPHSEFVLRLTSNKHP